MKDILQGWKEIEAYLGLTRKTILKMGYPVRKEGGTGTSQERIYAIREELFEHAKNGRIVSQ